MKQEKKIWDSAMIARDEKFRWLLINFPIYLFHSVDSSVFLMRHHLRHALRFFPFNRKIHNQIKIILPSNNPQLNFCHASCLIFAWEVCACILCQPLLPSAQRNQRNQQKPKNKVNEIWKFYARSLRNDFILVHFMAQCVSEIEMAANVKTANKNGIVGILCFCIKFIISPHAK